MQVWNLVLVLLSLPLAAQADDNASAADRALALTKPALGESPEAAEAKCVRLSAESRARGVKVLVIGFEGLASFSQASTVQAYRYHWELNHRVQATAPGAAMAGFVVRGTLAPVIARLHDKFEFLAFPFSAQADAPGSTPERCALAWLRVPGRKLVVTGHSFGGDAAVQLIARLAERNVKVDFALTIDPVPKTPRPYSVIRVIPNVRTWWNYYQRSFGPMGRSLPDAAVDERIAAGHTAVPFTGPVVNAMMSHVGALAR